MSRRTAAPVALAIAALTMACGDDRATPPVAAPAPGLLDSADQVLFNVGYNLADAGVKRGELKADTAYAFQEGSRFEFRNVRVDFNTPQGVKNGYMTAKRGTYDVRIGRFEGFGNVVVVTNDGRKLTSPQLKYDQGSNEIATDSAFVFEDARQLQRGVGLRTDPNLTRIQVLSKWSGVIRKVQVPSGTP